MIIGDIAFSVGRPGYQRISCAMGPGDLWFELPERVELRETYAESFMLMGLAGSMLKSEPLVVPDKYPISRGLIDNMQQAQQVLHAWNRRFSIVPIQARAVDVKTSGSGVASMFSGGVDSIATLSRHAEEIDQAIFICGFDFDADDATFDVAKRRNELLTRYFGVPLTFVYSNQMVWGKQTGVARNFWHSAYLSAATLFFGFDKVFFPGAHDYSRHHPVGSHLFLDHFWGNGVTQYVYADPDWNRARKLRQVAELPDMLGNLHVCWRDPVKNCGRCAKCVRTMTTLEILGARPISERHLSVQDVARMSLHDQDDLYFAIDNLLLANECGRQDLVKALKRTIARYDRQQALMYFDRGLLGSLLRRLRRRVRPYMGREGMTGGRPDLDL